MIIYPGLQFFAPAEAQLTNYFPSSSISTLLLSLHPIGFFFSALGKEKPRDGKNPAALVRPSGPLLHQNLTLSLLHLKVDRYIPVPYLPNRAPEKSLQNREPVS